MSEYTQAELTTELTTYFRNCQMDPAATEVEAMADELWSRFSVTLSSLDSVPAIDFIDCLFRHIS